MKISNAPTPAKLTHTTGPVIIEGAITPPPEAGPADRLEQPSTGAQAAQISPREFAETAKLGQGFQLGSTPPGTLEFRKIDRTPQVPPQDVTAARVVDGGTAVEIDVKLTGRPSDTFRLNATGSMFTSFDPPKVPLFLHRDSNDRSQPLQTVTQTVRFDISELRKLYANTVGHDPAGEKLSLIIGGRDVLLTF